jgi:K+-transporting ATPase ATPase C chain
VSSTASVRTRWSRSTRSRHRPPGLDPHISIANARVQARRVAEERGVPVRQVLDLVDDNTDGRLLGFIGEKGVNVLDLNLALDQLT